MEMYYEIPDSFWSLFRSVNREAYMEALLEIYEEYEYNNYYLSRDICLQILADFYVKKRITLQKEEQETELDILETPSGRILNWLVKTGWLKKVEDFSTMTTNIVFPDYAAVLIECFYKLVNGEEDDTTLYIQNVYATLFSFKNDKKSNISMLKTALINTRKLNKSLQDMLHNMDKFFQALLEKQFYGDILEEHLEGYVDEVVRKKYHILKTSDNFYIYKMDIKACLHELREDETLDGQALELIDAIERGFDDIEHRIANLDKENMKYVRATVGRLYYLLSGEADMKGMIAQLLEAISRSDQKADRIQEIGRHMNLSKFEVLTEKSLYKRRKPKADFAKGLEENLEEVQELERDEVLKLNRIINRYSKQEVEAFIESQMTDGVISVKDMKIEDDQAFEKLILAYDYGIRKDSPYEVVEEGKTAGNHRYRYPALTFVRRSI